MDVNLRLVDAIVDAALGEPYPLTSVLVHVQVIASLTAHRLKQSTAFNDTDLGNVSSGFTKQPA